MRHDSLDLATTITAPTNAADDKVYRDTTTSLGKGLLLLLFGEHKQPVTLITTPPVSVCPCGANELDTLGQGYYNGDHVKVEVIGDRWSS